MKKIIIITLLLVFFQSSGQTVNWSIDDNFNNFSYSASSTRIDSNDNVYTMYGTREVQFGTYKTYIEKYNSDGQRVSTFGSNGALHINSLLSLASNQFVISFEITNDDKLLFLIGTGSSSESTKLYFSRLNNDGTIDVTFDVSGTKDIYPDNVKYNSHRGALMIKVDEKYFLAHNYLNTTSVNFFAEVSCFDDSGNLINTIFNEGNLAVNYGSSYIYNFLEKIYYVNNHLYVVGRGHYTITTFDNFIFRVNSNTGLLDTTYGTNGLLLFNNKFASLFQEDGKIIDIRTIDISPAQQNITITRYLSDGSIDNSFAANGTLALGSPFNRYSLPKPYNLPNGDFLIHYRRSTFADDKDAIMYVKNSGELENAFGGNIIDNGNPILGTYGLPTFRANPGTLSFGANYFVTCSERQPSPQSVRTTKVNYNFQSLSTNDTNQNVFSIYPNPSNFEFTIDSNVALNSINIYTIDGRLLKTSLFNSTVFTYQMNVSSLPKGVYLLEVKSSNLKEIQKFIVK